MHALRDTIGLGLFVALGCTSKGDPRDTPATATSRVDPSSAASPVAPPPPNPAIRPSPPTISPPKAERELETPRGIDDPEAARDKVHGTLVFTTRAREGHVGEDPEALYALVLDGAKPTPRRLVAAEDHATTLGFPGMDPTGKTVVYVKELEAAYDKRGEIWTVPAAGGTPYRIARCTDSCRSPSILGDGRVVYVDHGPALTQATVRFVKAGNKDPQSSAVFFGAAKELATCSITIEVDRPGGHLLVNVNNELGWPECTTDASWLFDMRSLAQTKLDRPAPTRGTCAASFGDDGRIHVGGYECAPSGSFAADGTRPTFPDPRLKDGAAPATRWRIVQRGDALVATPPEGDPERAFVVFEGNVASFAFRAR